MAENINIGNTPEGRYERELELYGAFSEAEDKYVDEMLDDTKAARIRAEHRRKTVRMRSSIAACAAVLAIVVGIGVIPKGGMKSSESARNNDAAVAERADEAPDAKSDEAAENIEPPRRESEGTAATTAAAAPEAAAAQEDAAEYAEAEPSAAADSDKPQTIQGSIGDNDGKKTNDGSMGHSVKPEMEEEFKSDDAGVPENTVRSRTLRLSDGRSYYVGDGIVDKKLCGELIGETDGRKVFALEGFDPDYITAAEEDGILYAAVTDDLSRASLAELSEGLGFKEHLFCEKYMGEDGEFEPITDEIFKNSAFKLVTEFADSYKPDPEWELPTNKAGTFICRIGTKDETYISPVYITTVGDAIIVSCYDSSALYVKK